MKAILLNGARESADTAPGLLNDALASAGWLVTPCVLREMKIADCLGCFGCWIKTPGRCIIHDEADDIARAWVNSDGAILLSPVTFGGYSSELKKALDRMICLAQPFFRKVRGETHHVPRYDRQWPILVIGTLPAPDPESERLFADLVRRNSINMDALVCHCGFLYDHEAPDAKLKKIRTWLDTIVSGQNG